MRILESMIEFVAFSALLLGTMTGHMASCHVWPCSNDDSEVSLAEKSFKAEKANRRYGRPRNVRTAESLKVAAGQRPIQQNDGSYEYELEESDEELKVEDAEVTVASAIFHAKSFVFRGWYKKTVKNIFDVSPKSVDFTRPVDASMQMNRWIRHETHDLIKEVIQPGDIDGDSSVVFTSAVYLKGFWVNPFDRRRTEIRPSYVNGGPGRNVSTMTTTAEFNYGELPEIKAKFIELPYENNPQNASLSMFVIIPNDVGGIDELIKNVEKMNIRKLHGGRETKIELTLPKFEIETTINLKEVAKSLGITDIFENGADFTKITGHDGLSVSKIVQKTVITVDEKGTEAASVSVGTVTMLSGAKPISFIVDRPFIGIVADDVGVPYFMAVVADPSSKSSC